jgi:hypothetical protein
MQFVFRIGPLPADETTFAYFAHPGRCGEETFFASSDRDALARIASTYAGEPIEVEPDLAEAGGSMGMLPGPITPNRARMIGSMAFDIALPGRFQAITVMGLLHEFSVACAAFCRAAPWQWSYARNPLRIEVQGSASCVCDGVVMGWRGEPFGLALFPQTGIVERLGTATLRDLPNAVADLTTLGVTFDSEPAFAVDAMRRAFGLPRFPVPVHLIDGRWGDLGDGDMAKLIAVLRAIEVLTDAGVDSAGHLRAGDLEVRALAVPHKGD